MSHQPPLTELVLDVTNACHHRCIHCSTIGGEALENELTQAERLRVLQEARALGLVELRLLGGDPLFRLDDTRELLVNANKLGVQKALVCTSAVERDLQWLQVFARFSPMTVATEASIYSPCPAIHDGITQVDGSLERLLITSEEATRLRFSFSWNFVWMKPNFFELEPVLALASRMGIKTVRILRLMLNGRAHDNVRTLALPAEWEAGCGTVIRAAMERFPNVALSYSKPMAFQLERTHNGNSAQCTAGESQLAIEADGTVLPCIGMKGRRDLWLGNVRAQPLAEIWNSCAGMRLRSLSQNLRECPAVLHRTEPALVRLVSGKRRD